MADYYTHFSVIIDLPDVAAQDYALAIHAKAESLTSEQEVPGEIPTELHTFLDDWTFDAERAGHRLQPALWLHSEHGGVDAACDFIQHLLKRFNPQGFIAFSWSYDCNKPRTDAFGGGAAFITATDIHSITTCDWIANHINQHNKPSPCQTTAT